MRMCGPLHTVIAGHSRSKNGVLSHAYGPAILEAMQHEKGNVLWRRFIMDARVKPAHDAEVGPPALKNPVTFFILSVAQKRPIF